MVKVVTVMLRLFLRVYISLFSQKPSHPQLSSTANLTWLLGGIEALHGHQDYDMQHTMQSTWRESADTTTKHLRGSKLEVLCSAAINTLGYIAPLWQTRLSEKIVNYKCRQN